MKKILLVVFLLASVIADSNAQRVNFDSLKRVLAMRSATDISRVTIIEKLQDVYSEYKPDSSIYYAKQLIEWATKHNDTTLLASTREGIAFALYIKGDYPGALDMALLGLPNVETSKDRANLANTYNLIGNIYKGQENYPKALYYYRFCLHTAMAARDTVDMSYATFNLGEVFKLTNVLDSAMYYLKKAAVYDHVNHGQYKDVILDLWGDIYAKSKDYKKAIIYLQQSYTLAKKVSDFRTQAIACISLSNYYKQLNNTESVIYWAKEGLKAARIVSTKKIIYQSADLLSSAYGSKHQTDSALKYLTLSSTTKDSLYSASKFQAIDALNAAEASRNAQIADAEATYKNNLRFYLLLFVLAMILLAVFFLWRNSRNQKRANEQLSEQKEEIEAQRDSLEDINRELEIGSALERVRSIAMGMQQPDDMLDICRGISGELEALGVTNIRNVQTAIIYESKGVYINYEYYSLHKNTFITEVNYRHPIQAEFVKKMLVEGAYYTVTLEKAELMEWFEYQKTTNQFIDPYLAEAECLNYHWFSIGPVALGIALYAHISEEGLSLFKRFLDVFRLAYRRYKDVELAIAQTKEAQIELALERVRARTMAMQHSDELAETAYLLFQQFKELGENPDQATIGIINEADWVIEYWVTMHGNQSNRVYKFSIDEPDVTRKIYEAWKAKEKSLVIDLAGKELYDFSTYRAAMGGAPFNPDEERRVINVAIFSKGLINVQSHESRSAESVTLLERFAGVFESTYTRFLDLQKAEAQARESQIELSLERVRAKTMAMHQSTELGESALLLFQQLQELGLSFFRIGFYIWREDAGLVESWPSNGGLDGILPPIFLPFKEDDGHRGIYEAGLRGESTYEQTLGGEELAKHYEWILAHTDPEVTARSRALGITLPDPQYKYAAMFKGGYLMMIAREPKPDASGLLRRFAKVFEQAYIRFLDLQKAEAQALEAQIEAGLERVRSRTMAMHNSKDVGDAMATVFDQVIKLGVDPSIRTGVAIINKDTKYMEVWTAYSKSEEKVGLVVGNIDMTLHPMLNGAYTSWLSGATHSTYHLEGEDLKDYYRVINSADYHARFKIGDLPEQQFQNAFYFPEGLIYVFSNEQLPASAVAIFKRFAGVFGLTYRRFLDLQKAEAQTREAMIEAGLERVRSRTMAMQKSDELAQTAVVVFKQLIVLGIQPNRLFIGIIHDDSGDIEFWATAEDGSKISNKFTGNINRNKSVDKMYRGWKSHKKSVIIDMKGQELQDYFSYLGDELKVPFKLGRSQKRRVQLITYFSQGFIGMASPEPQPAETTNLMERFASVFNLTYTRFNDLKIAEANAIQAIEDLIKLQTEKKRAEDALTDLKAAQTKLIQSEKMASLGELTAGIAHEIQNPLNFVNNFSDVSAELIDEMGEELDKGDIEEARAIASDIKLNLEKIRHHGGRADSIVKGMLQHSRTGGGEKQLVNMNALADEFLRLSYHGLRAKDKSFNADMITHFDPELPKISVIPQDMGRVMLNLFNNAFYAVNQKKKTAGDNYQPTVTVTTFAPPSGGWGATVRDNGNGIPDAIKDKIMQPFFTTKPTGEGTGLGLSLSYDIVVKGHGGKISVDTKESEFTEFTVWVPIA